MLEILVAGAIGVLYAACLRYNLDYSERNSRKDQKKDVLRNESDLTTQMQYFQNRYEPNESYSSQKPIIIIKDSKVFLVKGGSDE